LGIPKAGKDLGYIQELLGYKSSRTTEKFKSKYEKITEIRNPVEEIDI